MMKRKLGKQEKDDIKNWLKLSDPNQHCPHWFCDVCHAWFPRIAMPGIINCPCHVYSMKYVRKIARSMLRGN